MNYSAGAGGSLTGSTSQTVNAGSNGTAVTAVPNANYRFVQWSDGNLNATRTDLNIQANLNVSASFALTTSYTLQYNASAGGSVTGTTTQTVAPGGSGTQVTAVPNPGQMFLGWRRGDNTQATSRTDTNVQSDKTITAEFGAIDPVTSGTVTFGTGGRYRNLNHVLKNIGGSALTGNILIRPATGVTSDEIFTRADFTGNLNGYKVEFDGLCSNGQWIDLLGTSSRQQLYCIHISGGPTTTVEWKNYDLDTSVDTGYAVKAAYPRDCHLTLLDHHNITRQSGTVVETVHPWYVYGGNHDGGDPSLTSLVLKHYCAAWYWNTNGMGSEFLESFYNEPRQVRVEIENIAIYSPNTSLVTWRAIGSLTGFVRNIASMGLRDNCFLPYQTAYENIMTTDNTGTVGHRSVVPSAQFSSLDPNSPNFLLPIEGSIADVGGSAPTLSTTDMYGKTWEVPYSIGPVQRDRVAVYYSLNYSAGAGGSVTGATTQSIVQGGNGTAVTAVPNSGYRFVQWSDGNLNATRTDTNVQANTSVSAVFAILTFTLNYSAGANGSLIGSVSQTVNYGANGTLVRAIPDSGYRFVSWSDGVLVADRTDLNVQANLNVSATFELSPVTTYTLTYSAGSGGSITGVSPQTVEEGSNGTQVTAVPAGGRRFVSWSDGVLTASRTDTNILANLSVSATFELIPVVTRNVTVSAETGGAVNPSGVQTVVSGSTLSISAVASTGYRFLHWNVTGNLTVTDVNDATTTVTNVTEDGSISATFEAIPISDNNPFLTTDDLIAFIDLNPTADLYILTDRSILELNVEDFKSLIRRRINSVEPKVYEWRVVIANVDFALSDIYVTVDNAYAARTW